MRNMILQKDYEKYELILPYKAALGRARQRFIYSELEKMHPCFSDEFCVDSSFKKFTKKGISSDVIVMHKFKLAEYESKRHFSGLGFALCEGGAGAKPVAKRFVSPRIKLAFCTGFLILILGGVFAARKLTNGRAAISAATTSVAKNVMLQNSSPALSESPVHLPRHFSGEDFIEVIIKNGGIVNTLRWSTDFFTETIEAEVEGVFPEVLSQNFLGCNLSSVKYKDEKPKLNFKNVQKFEFHSMETPVRNSENYFHLQTFVRATLEENSAELKEESQNPYRIVFHCSRQKFIPLVSALYDVFVSHNFLITEIMYSVVVNEELEVCISAEDSFSFAEGLPLKSLSEKLLPVHTQPERKSTPVRNYVAAPKSNENYGLKVGEITRNQVAESGRTQTVRTVFYKTPDGKLLKKEEVVN